GIFPSGLREGTGVGFYSSRSHLASGGQPVWPEAVLRLLFRSSRDHAGHYEGATDVGISSHGFSDRIEGNPQGVSEASRLPEARFLIRRRIACPVRQRCREDAEDGERIGGSSAHSALLARLQKFIAGLPCRQPGHVRGIHSETKAEFSHLHHAAEVPIISIFIGGLVIVLVVVLFESGRAEICRFAEIVASGRDRKRRYAPPRQRQVVRSTVKALFRLRLGLALEIHCLRVSLA